MSQQTDSLSFFWERQASIMGKRPRGRQIRETMPEGQAQLSLPNFPQPAAPAGEGEALSDGQIRQFVGFETAPAGEAGFLEQRREKVDGIGAWHYMRHPGDDYRGTIIFPADTSLPLVAGTWKRLSDGRIEAHVSLFELRVMREMRDILAEE